MSSSDTVNIVVKPIERGLDVERLAWVLHSFRVPERAHPTTNPCALCSEMAERITAEYDKAAPPSKSSGVA